MFIWFLIFYILFDLFDLFDLFYFYKKIDSLIVFYFINQYKIEIEMASLLKSRFSNVTAILQKNNAKIVPKTEFLMRFDGCSKGNPGFAASGAVIYQNDVEIWAGSKLVGYNETNNYAEYMGLIMGLNKAIELNITELTVEGDSMLIIKQMNGENKVKSSNLIELYKFATNLKAKFETITFSHIYRKYNTRADELCNLEIEKNGLM